MKIIYLFLSIFHLACSAGEMEKIYTGSTPADTIIKSFLGIPLSDSVDFIRWDLVVWDNEYRLKCNYGIGKANTNGFINGGIKIELKGKCIKEKNYYQFQHGTKTLKALQLNADLLHLVNANNTLLIGNGGWSYTLNNIKPTGNDNKSITAAPMALKDSMVFVGRTPCKIPGIIRPGDCYKLKWHIVLYTNTQMNKPTTYKVLGTPWRAEGGKTGKWSITGKAKQTIYQLDDGSGKGFLYLLRLDEHILVFTDAQGKLLVGNEDFSYTLNAR